MKSSIKDNHTRGKMGEYLKENIKKESKLSFVSAYFTIYAYEKLKKELDGIHGLRFLFGEPSFLKQLDPSKSKNRSFEIQDNDLVIPIDKRITQKAIAHECATWIEEKVEVKSMVKPNFLHGKVYHIEHPSGIEKVVVGSSNFTVGGLGLGGSPNMEFNIIVDGDRDREDIKNWFDELWNNDTGLVEDVKEQVIKYLEQLYIENSPEFVYFKTLFHIFEAYLDNQRSEGLFNEKLGFYDTQIWNLLFDFQRDGVKGAINKILKYNGCIIADSVGLGKTFEALAIIKYFELQNQRVLVLCPKKLRANWTIYQANQNNVLNPLQKDRFNYTILYHTDLGRKSGQSEANGLDFENFNWGAYDLVVIDESHNFRGNPKAKRKDGDIIYNRAAFLLEKVIKEGGKTKVLLLSATPVNNNLKDLRNQISLITEGKNGALAETDQIVDIAQTLKIAQTQFTNWADIKRNPERNAKQLLERLDSSFFKLLDALTIARSRKHIKNFYNVGDITNFPNRLKPISVYPNIDLKDRFLSYDRLNQEILKYKLSLFNPSAYVKEEFKAKYESLAGTQVLAFKQDDREHFLIGMMKVGFLKRLESSIKSFEISLDKTLQKIEDREKKILEFLETRTPVKDETFEEIPSEIIEQEDDDEMEQWQVGKKLKFNLADLELDRWLEDLKKDKEALATLYNNARAVDAERDAKLHELKKIIQKKVQEPINENNKKIIVFTAFADTANYLYENLHIWAEKELRLKSALVTGTSTKTTIGKNDFSNILINFSPISKNRENYKSIGTTEQIDLLIATDCISEGQNLQDCDYLINYDIHWNPVRIIQRFGRIDRIGSKNKKIQLVNFWPTKDLDNYINLKERVEARMALVDMTATGEDNILNIEQIEELITDEFKYRNKQLKQLQEEVIDLEEMDENVSITDFTLDDFRIDLLNFLEKNRNQLEQAPLGLYAVVPSPNTINQNIINLSKFSEKEKEIIQSGVVFCLEQKSSLEENEKVNPLQPYFLVYVRNDGEVRFNFYNAKQVLEMYRMLCQGYSEPFEELCNNFNQETNNGSKMEKYTSLLQKAIHSISSHFKKKVINQLTKNRAAIISSEIEKMDDTNTFNLLTWLIIK